MQQKLSHIRDGVSFLTRMFRLVLWPATQASSLSRQTGILACFGTRWLGSLHDNSGWKSKLLCG